MKNNKTDNITMKTQLIVLIATVFLFSCSKSKLQQLEELRAERSKLEAKIKILEAEVAKETGKVVLKPTQIGASEIKFQEFNHYIEVQGKLDGEENVSVFPAGQGIVTKIRVAEGDLVKKDQILAELDNSVLKQTLAEVEQAYELANDIYNRQKTLWEQKIGSEVTYLQAKNSKESLEKKVATIKEQLELYLIKAPITGSVEELNLKIGQMASAASPLPVMRIVNFNSVKIMADIAESFASKVRKGDVVKVYFPDIDTEIQSTISFASKFINPTNRTFTAEVRFPAGSHELKANMVSILRIRDYYAEKSIVLPVSVIQNDASGAHVFVVENIEGKSVAKLRMVKTGQSYNGIIEVLEGLKEGEKVITAGYNDLEDGKEIVL